MIKKICKMSMLFMLIISTMSCVTGCESESERIIREGEEARQKIKDASDHYENLKRQISDLASQCAD